MPVELLIWIIPLPPILAFFLIALSTNRSKGLLASCGLAVTKVDEAFPEVLPGLRQWDGQLVPAQLQQRLLREHQRWRFVDRQMKDLENERARKIRTL